MEIKDNKTPAKPVFAVKGQKSNRLNLSWRHKGYSGFIEKVLIV